MGLDVVLYRFPDCDTEALLRLNERIDSFWAQQWRQRGELEPRYPTERMRSEARKILGPVCEFYGFPANAHESIGGMGVEIEYALADAPASPFHVGSWDNCFSIQMRQLSTLFRTQQPIEYEFVPEAIGKRDLLKPDWERSRDRMEGRLKQLIAMSHDHPDFVAISRCEPKEEFAEIRDGLKVMIETMEHVLRDERPHEFLLGWLE